MKAPIKILSSFACLLVLSSINLFADFDLRARSMTRDLMPDSSSVSYPNVVATSDAYVQSLNSSSLSPIPSYSI